MIKGREELQALRTEAAKRLQAENKRIIVCAGAGCVSKGAIKIYEKFAEIIKCVISELPSGSFLV